MRTKQKRKWWWAGLLALIVCVAGVLPKGIALARNTVDTQAVCSLEIRVGNPGETSYEELKEVPLSLRLYRVGEMDRDGAVAGTGDFSDMGVEQFNTAKSAEDLEPLVAGLEQRIAQETPDPYREETVTASSEWNDLETGLYLLLADSVELGDFGYQFSPILISLPTTGLIPGEDGEDDLYPLEYETSVLLKKERVDLFGSVAIEKTLESYHAGLGTAVFVFQVEAVKNGQVVYSDVLSLSFDAPGVKQTIAEHIPVGSTVTVTEVYSGASYRLTSEGSGSVMVEQADGPGREIPRVSFRNAYDNSSRYGSGVVNHFADGANDSGWTWTPVTDNET